MTISKKQQASVNKYVKEHYDAIRLTVPKGKREVIKAAAKAEGMSTNAFINKAIDKELNK